MPKSAFEFWICLQEHKWNERLKRRISINRLTGRSLDVSPFPVFIEENVVVVKGKRIPITDDEDEMFKIVSKVLWSDADESSSC